MQLSVIKSDGSTEQYFHTKVLSTINKSLDDVDRTNIVAAEQFSEAVTFHLYHNNPSESIKSEDIHQLIITALKQTGYDDAAEALKQHRMFRNINRSRIEVIHSNGSFVTQRWNKTKIVNKLVNKCELDRTLARAVASCVEEKILILNMTKIDHNLVGLLVVAETEIMLQAEKELQLAAN